MSGPRRAWAVPEPNKNINTKPRFFILILIKTDYKLYFRLMNVENYFFSITEFQIETLHGIMNDTGALYIGM